MENPDVPKRNFDVAVGRDDDEFVVKLCRALAAKERLTVLKTLDVPKCSSAISRETGIPLTSVCRHLEALADAGLLGVTYRPGPKGHVKYFSKAVPGFSVALGVPAPAERDGGREYTVEMPLGMFSACEVKAPCGMAGRESVIGKIDDPRAFFSPARAGAECLWFDSGFVTYFFPTNLFEGVKPREISFSFEICSEAICFNEDWPSDITVRVNDKELLTFVSVGDFGGRRGKYTPPYWPVTSSQFGILRKITVNGKGVFLDNSLVTNRVTVADLALSEHSAVKFEIGIKEDADHVGGLNLFGRNFGDFPQAIVMTVK